MAFREQTVAIVIIGVTGSGKSTFINLASGASLPFSKSLGSSTTELESSTFSLDGRTVTLIDTPGFDNTSLGVLNVLKLISDYLSGLYSQGAKLAGVIYMHCITEDRLCGPSRHNFHVFRKFCGDTSLRDVLIVTNKWPGGGPSNGEERKQELTNKDEFFRSAVDKGARMLCHDGSQASAHAILRHLINRGPVVPPVQRDSFNQTTDLTRTSVGADAVRKLTGQVEHHTKAFGELCQGIDVATSTNDGKTRDILQERAKDSLEKIERVRHDLEQMVTNLATENSRLEGENCRYKKDISAQKAEAELRIRLLGEERRARELAEVERSRAEVRLAEERSLWERQKMERKSMGEHARPTYDTLFVCGVLILALICVSRCVFVGSTFLLL